MFLLHRRRTRILKLACIVLYCLLIPVPGGTGALAHSGAPPLQHNRETIAALDEEIARCAGERDLAVLRGLRWCVAFCDDDANFEFTFTNYVTMLYELTAHDSHPVVARIVHDLILKEFERALPRFHKLFSASAAGYEDFISILPVAYHHQVPITALKEFAAARFDKVKAPDRLGEFRRTAKARDYDHLTDLVVGAAFIDMACRWGVGKDFALPPNNFRTVLAECGRVPFLAGPDDDAYHDQNYYATHVLLALNHYGQLPLTASATADKVFSYLFAQYRDVRFEVGDLDLLCEYLYCFRQFAPPDAGLIAEGEQYVLSQQRSDGSWGTADDFEGDPYDRLHPTWTAITLLVQGH